LQGQQRKIKQLWRELKHMRRKNQQDRSLYLADKYDVISVEEPMLEDQNAEVDQINEDDKEIGEILKRLMPVLPSFSGKNFNLWAFKMEGLLGSVDLWQFVQNGLVNSHDKRKDKIALYLISSALDTSILSPILYEFGHIDNAKMLWDILEMKYSEKSASSYEETSEVDGEPVEDVESHCGQSHVDNDDCNEETVIEVMYDEENMSNEDWLKIKQEIQYIDNLLNVRGHLLEIMNDEESAAIVNVVEEIEKHVLDDVVDNVNTETKVNRDEVFEAATTELGAPTEANNNEEEHPDAVPKDFEEDLKFLEEWLEKPQLTGNCIAGEQNEKNKNCIDLNILMNGFESAGFDIWEQQAEVEEVKYCIEVPKLVNNNEVVVEEKDIVVFTYNQDLEFVDDIMDEEETEKVNKIFMHWSPEEIRFYYELMLQQIDDQKLNGEEKTTKNGMWQQFTYKQFFEEKVEEDKHGQSEIIFRLMTNTNKKMKDKKLKHGIFSKRGRLKLKMHRGFRIWKRRKRKTHSYMELKQILRFCLNCPL
jgi:hypothetical protein